MSRNVPAVAGAVYAEANWGRWVAWCVGTYCFAAMQLSVYQPTFRCLDCGVSAAVIWPDCAADIARLLLMRPDPRTRNWHHGESLHDLLAENLTHGILPAPVEQLEDVGSGPLLSIVGDRITRDVLAVPATRRALGGSA